MEDVGSNPTGVGDIFVFLCATLFLPGAIAQTVSFVIFTQHFNLPHLKHFKWYNSPFYSSWKVTKLLHETEAKVILAQLEKRKHKKETY